MKTYPEIVTSLDDRMPSAIVRIRGRVTLVFSESLTDSERGLWRERMVEYLLKEGVN